MNYSILLALIGVTVVLSDPVYIDMKVNCNDHKDNMKHWCAELYVYEDDTEGNHDIMAHKQFCSDGDYEKIQLGPYYPIHDGITVEYEFKWQVNHNCTTGYFWRCLRAKDEKVVSIFGTQHVEMEANIYDIGTINGCPDPNHPLPPDDHED